MRTAWLPMVGLKVEATAIASSITSGIGVSLMRGAEIAPAGSTLTNHVLGAEVCLAHCPCGLSDSEARFAHVTIINR